jgi:flavin reductase (DIM6/NTAB) family NADH-FMN oxidoreductase RutF
MANVPDGPLPQPTSGVAGCDDALTPADEPPLAVRQRDGVRPEVDPRAYREVLGHFPTGVTVVTAATVGGPVGLSIASFTSVSLEPPLVGFLPARTSRSWPRIRAVGRFCVNVLAADQEALARLFAAPHDERFDGVAWRPAPYSGAPLLDGAVAWVDCAIEAVVPAGDHHFVLGRVHDLGLENAAADPLVFFRGGYGTLA